MSDQQLRDLQTIIGRQEEELRQARLREVALELRVANMREALVAVERVGVLNGCPYCGYRKPQGHAGHCPIGNAFTDLEASDG